MSGDLTKSKVRIKKSLKKKDIIIGVVVFVVLLCASAAISWFLMQKNNTKNPSNGTNLVLSPIDEKVSDIQKNYSSNKNVEDAVKSYDEAISEAKDSVKKSEILIAKSVMYLNNKNYDEALTFASEALALNPNSNSYQYIAQVYSVMGKKDEAISSYKKAIELIDKTDPMAKSDVKYYQDSIVQLEKSNPEATN